MRDAVEITNLDLTPWEVETVLDLSKEFKAATKELADKPPELSMKSLDGMLAGVAKK